MSALDDKQEIARADQKNVMEAFAKSDAKIADLTKALFTAVDSGFLAGVMLINQNHASVLETTNVGQPALHAALASKDAQSKQLALNEKFFKTLLDKVLKFNPKTIYLTDEKNRTIFAEAKVKQDEYTQSAPSQDGAMKQIRHILQDTQMNLRELAEEIIAEQKAIIVDKKSEIIDVNVQLLAGVIFVAMRNNYPHIISELIELDKEYQEHFADDIKQFKDPSQAQRYSNITVELFSVREDPNGARVAPMTAGIEAGSVEATQELLKYVLANTKLDTQNLDYFKRLIELCRKQKDKAIYRMVLTILFTQFKDDSLQKHLVDKYPLDVVRYLLPDMFKQNIEVEINEFGELPYDIFNKLLKLLTGDEVDQYKPGDDLDPDDKKQVASILEHFKEFKSRKGSYLDLSKQPTLQNSQKIEMNKLIEARLEVYKIVLDWYADPDAPSEDLFDRAAVELRTPEAQTFFSSLTKEKGVNPVVRQDGTLNPYVFNLVQHAASRDNIQRHIESVLKDSTNPKELFTLVDDNGETVFHKAARNSNPDVLRYLLEQVKAENSKIAKSDKELIEFCERKPTAKDSTQTTYSVADLATIYGSFEHIKMLEAHHVRFVFHPKDQAFDSVYYAAGSDAGKLKFFLRDVDSKNAPQYKDNLEARVLYAAEMSQVESVKLLMKFADKELTRKIAKSLAKKVADDKPQDSSYQFLYGIYDRTFADTNRLPASDENDKLKEQGEAALKALDASLANEFIPEAKAKTKIHVLQNARVLASQKATCELFDGLNRIDPKAADAKEQATTQIGAYHEKSKVFTKSGQKAAKVLCAVLLCAAVGLLLGAIIAAAITGNVGALFAGYAAWKSGGVVLGMVLGGIIGGGVSGVVVGSRLFKPNRNVNKVNEKANEYHQQAVAAKTQ